MSNKIELKRSIFGYKGHLIIICCGIAGAILNIVNTMKVGLTCPGIIYGIAALAGAYAAGWFGFQLIAFKAVDQISLLEGFIIGRENVYTLGKHDTKPLRSIEWRNIDKVEVEQTKFQKFFNYGKVSLWEEWENLQYCVYQFTYVKDPRLVRKTWLAANLKTNIQ